MYEDQEKGLSEVSVAVDTLHKMGDDMHDELSRQQKYVSSVIHSWIRRTGTDHNNTEI